MPGQNPVVAEHYPDHFHTVSFPLHGSTIGRGLITPLLYVEKRQIVIDDVRLITRRAEANLTIDVGFMPGAAPVSSWTGTLTTTNASATVTINSTSAGRLSVGDRFVNAITGTAISGLPADVYVSALNGTYPISATDLTGTLTINSGTGVTAAGPTAANAINFKSVLTAPMAAGTDNTMVVGAINSNLTTIPTAAPNNLEVTEANNIVLGPVTVGTTTTLGNVICIEARGAATTNYVGTLQIRYRERLA